MGVSISTKKIQMDDLDLSLVIWDIAGFEQENHYTHYLRGVQGIIWVVDGTEPESLEILDTISESLPDITQIPSLCFINKHDLVNQWLIGEKEMEKINKTFSLVLNSSAKTGENVEKGFYELAKKLILK